MSGTDSDGFSLASPDEPIQREFQGLIQDVCTPLVAQAGRLLDGIYLYGSVARGCPMES